MALFNLPNRSLPPLGHVFIKHPLLQPFAVFGDLTVQVALGHQRRDGRGDGAAVAAVLNVYQDGNFRIVHRRKSGEHGVVFALIILYRSGFAADVDAGDLRNAGRTVQKGLSHPRNNGFEVLLIYGDIVPLNLETLPLSIIPHPGTLHQVRGVPVAPVGDSSGKIGDLKACHFVLALPDGQRAVPDGFPAALLLVLFVEESTVGDEAFDLTGEINA